jgi:hypothetical protein
VGQIANSVKLDMKQRGDVVGGKKIEMNAKKSR